MAATLRCGIHTWSKHTTEEIGRPEAAACNFSSHSQHCADCSLSTSLLSSHQEASSHCPALRVCPFHSPLL